MGAYERGLHAKGDKDFAVFVAVASESDSLPVGKVRALWTPAALREKDGEIVSLENFHRKAIIDAAVRLRAKYESAAKIKR